MSENDKTADWPIYRDGNGAIIPDEALDFYDGPYDGPPSKALSETWQKVIAEIGVRHAQDPSHKRGVSNT